MRNREYWQKRFSAVEEMRNKRGRLTVDQIAPHFDRAQAAIDKEICVWYQRFADNNGISLAEAKKLLRQNELDELKWDIEEYIKRGQENTVSQKWLKELENASAKFHISRLEALKLRTQNAAENAFAAEQNRLTERLMDTWKEDYYHTAFEVQKGFSLGFDVAQVDENRVNKLLDTPWTADGQTFSDRIWKSKAQLLDSVSSELTQMCILGKAPDDAIAAIAKRMNVAKSQAGRLVMTENAYFGSVAQQQCYQDLDVERYQIVATLDSRTSDICRHLDGKVFDMKDYEPGVTAPPFHVYCRSCTVPYFADNDENGMRAARNAEGKTYYVPASMTYGEWQEKYVQTGGKQPEPVAQPTKSAIIKPKIAENGDTAVHSLGKLDIETYKCVTEQIITDEVIITDERIAHIKERHPNDYERYCSYIPEIIQKPDYILEDSRPNTALVMKHIEEAGEHFRLTLRLVAASDNPDYKNSVITFLKIREKEWNRLVKNKRILYKHE